MMDPSEVEFLAEKEMVTIIPNFSHDKFYLISGDIGPFNPGLPVDVPLWLAVNLKQRQKCRIQPPEWMNVGEFTKHSCSFVSDFIVNGSYGTNYIQ